MRVHLDMAPTRRAAVPHRAARRSARFGLPLIVLLALIAGSAPATALGAVGPLGFQSTAGIDLAPPYANLNPNTGMSCPTTGLCVAVDQQGNELYTTDPTAAKPVWSTPVPIDPHPLTGISCPTAALCLAVDTAGDVLVTTTPTATTPAWTTETGIGPSGGLTSISCAGPAVCVAVGALGDAVITTDPTDPVPVWSSPVTVDTAGTVKLTSVSCPTSGLCAAVDNKGNAVTTTDPSATTPTWVVESGIATGTSDELDVSCPTAGLCLALTQGGDETFTTDPGDPTPHWSTPTPMYTGGYFISALSCPAAGLCVALDDGGDALATTTPTAATLWQVTATVLPSFTGTGLSCVSGSSVVCAAGDSEGDTATATAASSSAIPVWAASAKSDGTSSLSTISCVTGLCLTGDGLGSLFATQDPADASPVWASGLGPDPGASIDGVSCVSAAFCALVTSDGKAWMSSAPASSGTWKSAQLVAPASATLVAISCVTGMCIAVDNSGDAYEATSPTPNAPGWGAAVPIDGAVNTEVPLALSCASTALCAATDETGRVTISTDPSAATPTWTAAPLEQGRIQAISCPSTSLCVAGDDSGNVLITTNPSAPTPTWTTTAVDPFGHGITGVSCPSTSFCMAVDGKGNAVATDDPTDATPVWTAVGQIDDRPLDAISCITGSCNAGDFGGFALAADVNALAVNVYGLGTVSGTGIASCASTCYGAYTAGQSVTLTATPATGYVFAGWAGECTGIASCTVTVTNEHAVSATFVPAEALGVVMDGSGSGTVTSDSGGISCPGTCSAEYGHGLTVTLTATAASGSAFTGWSGGGCSGTGTCAVAMNAIELVKATFDRSPTLTVAVSGSGSVSGAAKALSGAAAISCPGACAAQYPVGTLVSLTATPAAGEVLTGWSGGGCSGAGTCVVAPLTDTMVTATFGPAPPAGSASGGSGSGSGGSGSGSGGSGSSTPSLTVTETGLGFGIITGGELTCPGYCANTYAAGTTVTLTATARSGSIFSGWSGGGCSGTGSCTVTIGTGATTVSAEFDPSTIPAASSVTGSGSTSTGTSKTKGGKQKAKGKHKAKGGKHKTKGTHKTKGGKHKA